MEFFKPKSDINFYKLRLWAAGFSVIVFLASVISLSIHGLNLGLDFTGGTQIQLSFKQAPNLNNLRQKLKSAGFIKEQVQSYGNSKTVLITLNPDHGKAKTQQDEKKMQTKITQQVLQTLPGSHFERRTFIGAQVSSELAYHGILAIFVAMLATMVYIAFRFEWRLAVGAAVALIHDPILILGVFSFFHIQFSLVVLAAILTIIGYSLHDTIVVYDRIRENFRKVRRGTPIEVVNSSINQTLSRTVISSSLTFVVVVVLFIFGGPTIHDFALALIVGIAIGTYSSIYIAGSLAVGLGLSRKDLMTTAKKDFDDLP